MGLNLSYDYGQTPLDEEECEGLKISSITTKAQLDEFEQKNIEDAIFWTIGLKITQEKLLTEGFVKTLHKRMFGDIWSWAGKYRLSNKNLGVDRWQIGIELHKLLDDTKFWIDDQKLSPEEIAIRFKHRIVSIHCFSNGNGRHSRLMADLIINKIYRKDVFTWGQSIESQIVDVRKEYLSSLRKADHGRFTDLIRFSRA